MKRRLVIVIGVVAVFNLATVGAAFAAHPFDGATPLGNPQDALLGEAGIDPCDGDHSLHSGIEHQYDLDGDTVPETTLGPASLGLVAHAAGVGH